MAKPTFLERFLTAWNVFSSQEQEDEYPLYTREVGSGSSRPKHRTTISPETEKSIISAIYNRAAIDVAMMPIRHVRVDENDNFIDRIDSGLDRCLTLESNIDQSGFSFIQDVVISMFDEGAVAVVPVDTSVNMIYTGSYDILSLRTGKILEWFPRHVRLRVYNDQKGEKEDIILPKSKVAIIENPLYSVMNGPNSTLQRLKSKLNLLDAIDKQSGSGKLDIIIQLPFAIKSDARKKLADQRIAQLEEQLQDSKHGVAYVDGTEKVIQLNRPSENNLMGQIEYLTRMLYSQLGLSEQIFDGTADEAQFINYFNRTIEPVLLALSSEFKRKFLTKTALTQGQSIKYFRNPFRFVTAANLAELADKFTRNEIVTGNEFRAVIGFRPSKDPSANELRNKNLNVPTDAVPTPVATS